MKESCNVTNKSAGIVIYNIPELHVRRQFSPHEVKPNISVTELNALAMQPGGRELIYDYLFINDAQVLRYLINGDVPPEYYLTEDQISTWMENCSLDEFKDALDWAPDGTKDLIKSYAVSKPLNDHSKRQAVKDQLGFDVTAAIENSKIEKDNKEVKETKATSTATGRRTTATTIKKPVEIKTE